MKFSHILALAGVAASAPASESSTTFCFIEDTTDVPPSLLRALAPIADRLTCSRSPTWQPATIPDITLTSPTNSGRKFSFSKINYADSDQTPLSFSLGQFATQEPLAGNNLSILKDQLYVYLAMEASVLSFGGEMTSVLPRLFLEFQVARVSRAQDRGTTDADVDGLLRKLISEAHEEKEDQALIDELRDMAISNRVELRSPSSVPV